ncbi:EI24 domain-containing protein [Acidimangrovimonas sediminis]|uniref:EI24 domain-containing protein n=1 Tax=Acidimangrovimonas sediminis TaxID=2056283 RepID=UPI000C80820D|nr:EI24 domain-containing protein [Acidimangrovimonas sediminis]
MILGDFLLAVGQMGDPRFQRVLWLGLGLTVLLLIAVYGGFVWLIALFVPGSITLPWVGWTLHPDFALSLAAGVLMMVASVFLMVPVASAFSGLFLDQVAEAVEDVHYPALPPAPALPWSEMLGDALRFFVVLVLVNAVALTLGLLLGPLAPVLFWAVNGYLLGREYFQMAAMRRVGRKGATALRRRHGVEIWAAGVLMALPLTVPVLNLLVPILGAATFTHLFHRLSGLRPARNV